MSRMGQNSNVLYLYFVVPYPVLKGQNGAQFNGQNGQDRQISQSGILQDLFFHGKGRWSSCRIA